MTVGIFDQAARSALYGAAGDLQSDVAEIGFGGVYELDLRRSLRKALQAQTGARVTPERALPETTAWNGSPHGFDLAVDQGDELVAAFELKWCRAVGNLGEALWDVLKLLAFTSNESMQVFLAYAAPNRVWSKPGKHPAGLFGGGAYEVATLLASYESDWRWLLTGNKTARPARLRANFRTVSIAAVPIHSATESDWELRCVRVEGSADGVVYFDENGWPLP